MRRLAIFFFIFSNISLIAQNNIDCYTIVAGCKSTDTHNVIVAHNEDDYGDLIVNLYKIQEKRYRSNSVYRTISGIEIPQVSTTNSYIWFETTQEKFGDFFVNEYGVAVCSNACSSKEDTAQGSISYDLRKIVIQRAKSAREAVHIAAKLVEKYGYASSGRTYCFADSKEAWLMAIVRGRHWIAERVPDNEVAIVPNYYTIGEVDLKDTSDFLACKDIIDYAIKRGWYNPSNDKKFNFRKAYSTTLNLYAFWNIPRHWAGLNMLSTKKYGLYDNFPFSFVPKKQIDIADLEKILSYHYEGTDFETSHKVRPNPHQNSINRICNSGTKFSVVVQLQAKDKSTKVNNSVIWFAALNPCVNAYIPIVFSIDSFPSVYHKYSQTKAMQHHFEKQTNTFEANPELAYSVFHERNKRIDADYWKKSKRAKKFKNKFEQKAKQQFVHNPQGKTSYDLLMEYYNLVRKSNKS
jgi:dipeptidase